MSGSSFISLQNHSINDSGNKLKDNLYNKNLIKDNHNIIIPKLIRNKIIIPKDESNQYNKEFKKIIFYKVIFIEAAEKLKNNEIENKINFGLTNKLLMNNNSFSNVSINIPTDLSDISNDIFDASNKEKNILNKKRKRRIFNVIYPDNFFIFTKGENNNEKIMELIDESCKNSIKSKTKEHKKGEKKRKNNSDNIRKKIKSKFLKRLKFNIQKYLELKPYEKFIFLPQTFITKISKKENKEILDITLKEIFKKYSCKIVKKKQFKNNIIDNKEREKTLRDNPKGNFVNMKLYQIYDEYLRSKEFADDVLNIKNKNNYEYTKKYVNLAFDLNNFFYN